MHHNGFLRVLIHISDNERKFCSLKMIAVRMQLCFHQECVAVRQIAVWRSDDKSSKSDAAPNRARGLSRPALLLIRIIQVLTNNFLVYVAKNKAWMERANTWPEHTLCSGENQISLILFNPWERSEAFPAFVSGGFLEMLPLNVSEPQ